MLARTEQTRKPYRLATRATLDAEPPFTFELTRKLLAEALRGPKAGRTSSHPEPSDQAIKFLTATLNNRHAFYFSAQQARSIKERRDHAKALIDELRGIMPLIVKDAEQQLLKDDVFSHNAFAAASALHEFLSSDVPVRALLPVHLPENIRSWEWAAPTLVRRPTYHRPHRRA